MQRFRSWGTACAVVLFSYAIALAPERSSAYFSHIAQFMFSTERQPSAYAIATKQIALSANQEAVAYQESTKALADSVRALAQSDRVAKAITDFDPMLGQVDSNKCEAQGRNTWYLEAANQVQKDRRSAMGAFSADRMRTAAQVTARQLASHMNQYCTVSEAKAEMCSLRPNGMQGWDSNYAGAFSENTLSPEGEAAGFAYAATVADAAMAPTVECGSAACATSAAQSLAAASMASMAAEALTGQLTARRVAVVTGQ